MCNSLRPHGLQHARPPCLSPTSGVYTNSCPLSWWCHQTISSSVVPFSSWLQPFWVSGSFSTSQFFTSGGQSIGASASASVLPVNIQDWSPLGWTGLISLQSKGLLSFSNTTIQKHQFFGAQLSLWSNSHIHTWLLENLNLTWSWNYISTIFVQAALVSTEGFIMSVTDFPFYREANKGESTQQRWAPVLTIYT